MVVGRLNNMLAIGAMVLMGCGASQGGPGQPTSTPGEAIFMAECAVCHGRDGTLGMGGAKNLARTTLNGAEMTAVITKGRGGMAGFGGILTGDQIADVVEHVHTLAADQ